MTDLAIELHSVRKSYRYFTLDNIDLQVPQGQIREQFDVPTLILHGDDDQIVPIGASASLSSKIVRGAALKVYPGLSHGMCTINKDQINTDLLAFIKS